MPLVFRGWDRFLKVPVKLLDFSLAIGYSLLEKRLNFLLVIAYSLVDGSTYQKPATDLGSTTGSARDSGSAKELSGVLELFREAASAEYFQQLEQDLKLSSRRRIYDLPLVMWLMMVQRWEGRATLSTAVQQVVEKRPAVLVGDHKRVREGTVSIHTGAYSDARQKMPVEAAERVSDRVFEHLMQNRRAALPGWNRPPSRKIGEALRIRAIKGDEPLSQKPAAWIAESKETELLSTKPS